MQFQSIIAVLSFALVVTAAPTTPSNSGPTCKAGTTASSCNSTPATSGSAVGGLLSVLPIGTLLGSIGNVLSCNVVSVIPIASGNNQVANACCNTSGVQNGLINLGTICVPIQA